MNAWDRLCAADQLVDLSAQCIRLQHPKSVQLARVTLDRVLRLPDEKIVSATAALSAWIDEQSVAPPAVPSKVRAAIALTGGPGIGGS